MNIMHITRRPQTLPRISLLAVFSLVMLLGPSESAFAQWTFNGSNINNTNTGNVGIGTTAPQAKLEVNQPNAGGLVYPFALSSGGNAGPGRGIAFQFNLPANPAAVLGAQIVAARESWGLPSYLAFSTHNGTAVAEVFRIGSNGAIGIVGNNSTYSATSNALVRIDNTSATGQSPLDFVINGTLRGRVRSDYAGNLNLVANGGEHNFFVGGDYTVGTAAMTIKTTGRVGIGTTGPLYSLDVNGGVNSFRAKAATTSSTDAIAAFENSSGIQAIVRGNGNVGIGTTNPANKLHVAGSITVDGNINAKYQDVAEWVPATRALPPGTVVTLNPTKSNLVEASSKAYDTRVAGVISAQPGIALGERAENKVLVATTGRVRMKVDATNGPIEIGDLLVTSDKEGVAMKSMPISVGGVEIHRPGTLIGKALEPLAKGQGEILVLLSLQ